MMSQIASGFRRVVSGLASLFFRPRQRQVAALVWRRRDGDDIEVLTITTRRSGRWSIPKGWPIKGMSSAEAAAQEAWEEAGVRGNVSEIPLGEYPYSKSQSGGRPTQRMTASVFPLHLSELQDDYPEAGQRKRVWRSATDAAEVFQEPALKAIVTAFRP